MSPKSSKYPKVENLRSLVARFAIILLRQLYWNADAALPKPARSEGLLSSRRTEYNGEYSLPTGSGRKPKKATA